VNIAQSYMQSKVGVGGGDLLLFDPLRMLLDDAAEAVAGPGRYQDRMAYVLDNLELTADEEASLHGWGEFCARYGRRILRINSQGFTSSHRFKKVYEAQRAFREATRDWQYDESEDWQ
jgi:TRAP-type mannitol/chloroaromatic compound transport system substrate-binding protein